MRSERRKRVSAGREGGPNGSDQTGATRLGHLDILNLNPLGKLPGAVWPMASEPLIIPQWAIDKYNLPPHFAAFPQELPRKLILGFSPSGICTACGEGRRPVVDRRERIHRWEIHTAQNRT